MSSAELPRLLAPSILSADFARLGEDVSAVLSAGADWVHFDVMDNHFVPNLTIGPAVCESLRGYGIEAFIDVHLMIEPVDAIVPAFAKAGADLISFHPEASQDVSRTVDLIMDHGCQAGLVFKVGTPIDALHQVLDRVDLVLMMSVEPGFGGQSFIPEAMDRVREARAILDSSSRDIRLEIDGGVTLDNVQDVVAAGVDTVVAGSAVFKAGSIENGYEQIVSDFKSRMGA